MASCTQIGSILQAYLDGEVSHSDKVILEEHVAQCVACRMLLRKHQRMAAELFEAFSDYRLRRELRGNILENLPLMEGSRAEHRQADLAGLNWRAKHPGSPWGKITRRVPVVAAFVLLVLAMVLRYNWPKQNPVAEPIGVVTHVAGDVSQILREDTERLSAELRDYVERGERYETQNASTMMLTLLGPTQIKLTENTRIQVVDERRLRVEEGEVWLDVGNDGRLFKISTPSGRITVFGTAFGVKVDLSEGPVTTVAVQRGEVQVEGDQKFELVRKDHLVRVVDREPTKPEKALVDKALAWADNIVEDTGARAFFQHEVLALSETTELRADQGAFIDVTRGGRDRVVSAITVRWAPDERTSGFAGYDIYVYDNDWRSLTSGHINGKLFEDKSVNSFTIDVPTEKSKGVKQLFIRIVPVHEDGSAEMKLDVSAVAS